MARLRIPPQYVSVGSLGFVAGWMSRGGEQMICLGQVSVTLQVAWLLDSAVTQGDEH